MVPERLEVRSFKDEDLPQVRELFKEGMIGSSGFSLLNCFFL